MTDKPFSVNEALRFARHDFLNQLQLIKMNIDLARLDEAKAAIDHYTTEVRAIYELSKLNLPRTYEWLQTANWRFPGFQVNITSDIGKSCELGLDQPISTALEWAALELHGKLSPYAEQELDIHVVSQSAGLKVTVEAKGEWEALAEEIPLDPQLKVEHEFKTSNNWRFHLEESKEG